MMRRYFYAFVILLFLNIAAKAAPGDTTIVQANSTNLDGYGSYDDSVVHFQASGKTYRSIYMIFTLGKHMCAGNPTYCGDWDYTIQNYLILPGGTNLEIGRLISP